MEKADDDDIASDDGMSQNYVADNSKDDSTYDGNEGDDGNKGVVSLTLEHVQGLFLILVLGYLGSMLVFLMELLCCGPN